jgi:pyruvate/2-oxoglutarate/acetoin dehydrogenase E1 component
MASISALSPSVPAPAPSSAGLTRDQLLELYYKYLYRRVRGAVPAGDYAVPIGQARVAREGRDLSIITYAATVWKALEAAARFRPSTTRRSSPP